MDGTSNFEQLDAKIAYLNEEGRSLVERAYCFAAEQHEGQLRASGEDYIIHPVQVAIILAEMFCDSVVIATALLHDVLEDTNTNYEELVYNFGREVANLVSGLTKLAKFGTLSVKEQQAKNFSKMILAVSEDIRIILVKLADRLHNMRTLSNLRLNKRKRIAQETLDIYAPIANHLGLYEIGRELELLAFIALFPLRYKTLKKESDQLIKAFIPTQQMLLKQLDELLSLNCRSFLIKQELRSIYKIYVKMLHNRTSLEDNLNLANFRIVLDDQEDCYAILGKIHGEFKPIPGKFKDYIAIPKLNGYRALHTEVLGPNGTIIKLKICNQTMERIAVYGIAAYWMFKRQENFSYNFYMKAKDWVVHLLELQNYGSTSLREFFDNVRGNLYSEKIYVFTPEGKSVVLANGSIVLDFAYALGCELGNTCVAAEVNHRLVDIFAVLDNGAVVKIITNKNVNPDLRWLSLVRTNLARRNIKKFLSKLARETLIENGEKLLSEYLDKFGYTLKDFKPDFYRKISFSMKEIYYKIGRGDLLPTVVSYQLINLAKGYTANKVKVLSNINNIPLKFSRCCYPIPGDRIGGYFTSNFGIDVHSYYCPVFNRLWHNNPQLILETHWDSEHLNEKFHTILSFEILNQAQYLNLVERTILEQHGEIKKTFYSKEYLQGYVLVTLLILVKGVTHLEKIIKKLEQIPTVEEVVRKDHYYG